MNFEVINEIKDNGHEEIIIEQMLTDTDIVSDARC